jgi:hypothetical protein
MEEVKKELGSGELGPAQTVAKPDKPYKSASGKGAASKGSSEVKKAIMTKKKVNDAA